MEISISQDENDILLNVKSNKSLEPYFFEKLIEKKDTKWLEPLKINGFFDANQIPTVEKGYAQEWLILNYVDSIVSKFVDEKYNDELAAVLSILKITSENAYNNFRVIGQCIKIISKIKTQKYDNKTLGYLIDYWFRCPYLKYVLHEFIYSLLPVVAKDNDKALFLFQSTMNGIWKLGEENDKFYFIKKIIDSKDLLLDLSNADYIGVVDICISLLEKLLGKQSSARKIDDIEFKLNIENNKYRLFINNNCILEEDFNERYADVSNIIKAIKQQIPPIDEEELERTGKLLYDDLFDENSAESIFDKERHLFYLIDYMSALIKKIFALNINKTSQTEDILIRLFNSKYDYFIKVAIYIACLNFTKYETFLIDFFKTNTNILDYIIRYYIFGDELKHLFESFENMDDMFIKIIKDSIDKGEYIKYKWENDRDLLWKQVRYKALRKIKFYNDNYEQMRESSSFDPDLIPAMSFSGVHTVTYESPISEEQILKMSNDELVVQIKAVKEKSRSFFTEISCQGLGKVLDKIIKNKPERFTNELYKFDKVQYEVIALMIDTFKEMLNNISFDMDKVISFLKLYTEKDSFWLDEYFYEEKKDLKDYFSHKPALKRFLRFIRDYLAKDEIAFNYNICSDIMIILNKCLEKHDFGEIEDVLFSNNDYAFYALNSLDGIFSLAILELVLRLIRDKNKYKEYWEGDIKPLYKELMAKGSISSYFIMGEYIAHFISFDRSWVNEIIKCTTPKNNMWQFFISGYLSSNAIYRDLYEIFGDNYIYALSYEFIDKDIRKRLAKHVTIAYLNGFDEKSKTRVFEEIIKLWDIDLINDAIAVCNGVIEKDFVEETTKEEVEKRILRIWNEVRLRYAKIENLNGDDIGLINNATHIITNFKNIDTDIISNLRFSYKYIKGSFNDYYFTEYFNELINTGVEHENMNDIIYEFFVECLPSYPEDQVRSLLDYLMKQDKTRYLREIMDSYLCTNSRSVFVDHIGKLLSE